MPRAKHPLVAADRADAAANLGGEGGEGEFVIGGGEATGGGVVGGGVFEVVAKLIDRLIEPALQQVLVPGM